MVEKKKRRFPIWLRIAAAAVASVLVLALAGVGLRYWITSDMGRGFVVSMIDGRRLPGLGTVRIVGGLKGDPLTAATLADIALVDDDGPWLRANDLRLQWDATKLLSGQLQIEAIDVGKVHVLRRPGPDRQRETSGGKSDIQLSLGRLTVSELRFEPAVFGPQAVFTVGGSAARSKDGAGHADLLLSPVSGPGDRIEATARWTADGVVQGKLDAEGPAAGALAQLIQAPQDASVKLSGLVSGSVLQFKADLGLAFSGADAARIRIARNGDAADLEADLKARGWALFDVVTQRTGDDFALRARANLAKLDAVPVTADLVAPAGRINVALTWRGGDKPFDVARLQGDDLDLNRLTNGAISGAGAAKGDLTPGAALLDWSWRGDLDIEALVFPGGKARRAKAAAVLSRQADEIRWQVSQGAAEAASIDALEDLRPAAYSFSSTGSLNLKTRRATLSRVQVRGETLSAAGQGAYAIDTGAMKLEGAAELLRLSAVSPFAGMAHGTWAVERTSAAAPWRIRADAAGRNIASPDAVLASLAGRDPRVKLSAIFDKGRFLIESGEVRADGIEAYMTGRVMDNGAITGHAMGKLRRPVVISGQRLNAVSFEADISGRTSTPAIDARFANGEAMIAGLALSGVRGTARVRLGDRIAADIALDGALDGAAQDQPMKLSAAVVGDRKGWIMSNAQLRIGALKADAIRLVVDKAGDLDLAWKLAGPLAGFYGIEAGQIDASGSMKTTKGDLVLDSKGEITGFKRAGVSIDKASFSASARNGAISLDSQIKGDAGVSLDLTIAAHGKSQGEGDEAVWTGDASLSGLLDRARIATPQPIAWTFGASGWSVDGGLVGLGGSMTGKAALSPGLATADLTLDRVNLAAITRLARSERLSGELSGVAHFRNDNGRASGDLVLDAKNVNPRGVDANSVNLALKARLADNVLEADANGAGQGFSLAAASRLRVQAGQGFDLSVDPNAPLEGDVTLNGSVEPAWALFGPEGQALRGDVVARIAASGTIASPALTGDYMFSKGGYEHGETGLKLVNIASSGRFNQRSLDVVSLSADDGTGGKLTGGGQITWDRDLDGSVKFHAENLHALARPDRSAIVSGDGALSLDVDAVRVSGAMTVESARVSVEQPAASTVPTLPRLRRINFPAGQTSEEPKAPPAKQRPVLLDLKVKAPRRVFVFGRGLDTEWAADFAVSGSINDPIVRGAATLVRGDLDLAGRRFQFDTGTLNFDGPIRTSRIDISATRNAADVTASVHVTGTPVEPKFTLESTPALPQDEILARVLFGRSASQLSALEAAQLAAGLAQLAGGQAGFDPAGLLRQAAGLDRLSVGASEGAATVEAGKYLADNVYLQLGAGGAGGVGAAVEWEPRPNLEITSSAQGNGDTRLAVRWKKNFDKPKAPAPAPSQPPK